MKREGDEGVVSARPQSGHARLRDLFHAAAEADESERAKLLSDLEADDPHLARELARLLQVDAQPDRLPDQPLPMAALLPQTFAELDEPVLSPTRIGHYQIIRHIGTGGMAVVYEAEQKNPRRRVALKVVRPGLATKHALARFQAEAQILASLHHPNIAQVYEAGVAEEPHGAMNLPFFAMELIDGPPLTRYAQTQALTTAQRLALVAAVCDAVQYAHEHGVVHRDLKPENVLVEAGGAPKVLDFGIARATESEFRVTRSRTGTAELIGTVAYMSPEQTLGEPSRIDARTDVYSLGVILYELLTGQLPYALDSKLIHDAVRIIREKAPVRLSTISRRYGGDLEVIVGKALEKDPARRYASAAALADDLRRYLRREPIRAHRPSTVYRLRKLVARNPVPAVLVGIMFITLLAGSIGMTVLYFRAADESRTVQQAAAVLEQMLGELHLDALGERQIPLRKALDAAVLRIDQELVAQPAIAARLRWRIGRGYFSLGEVELALSQFERSLAAAEAAHGNQSVDAARARRAIGDVYQSTGNNSAAISHYRGALDILRRVLGSEHLDVADVASQLGLALAGTGDLSGAGALVEGALEHSRRQTGDSSPETAHFMMNLAELRLTGQHRFAEAEQMARQAITILRATRREDDNELTYSLRLLADSLVAQERTAEAEPVAQEVLNVYRKKFGEDHRLVADQAERLGVIVAALRRGGEAAVSPSEALRPTQP